MGHKYPDDSCISGPKSHQNAVFVQVYYVKNVLLHVNAVIIQLVQNVCQNVYVKKRNFAINAFKQLKLYYLMNVFIF